ncbi:hypothetical protein COU55_02100 [Candidatus Pacearchaeota archaeon CG10_big_fil_rev_8_21_14_0_10_31_59]|nr:MAG: hypothetical protein COU55_02100 [Candidatus Pacearchaeota archaeon CG10_big_fil_rev_8_21_14_0_10_31_59]
MLIKNKNGQAWSLDLIIAGVIFLIGIVILFYYAINYSSQSKNQLDELLYEGNLASELILSEEESGILSNGIVNQTKLDFFANLNDTSKRNLIGIKDNFYFVMDNLEINGEPANYVGIINSSETENLIQTTRLTIYKNKPIKFELFAWS